jgi:hypothetical protein
LERRGILQQKNKGSFYFHCPKRLLTTKNNQSKPAHKIKMLSLFFIQRPRHIAAFFRFPHSASRLASLLSPSFGFASFRCSFHYASHATPFFVSSFHAAIFPMKKIFTVSIATIRKFSLRADSFFRFEFLK